MFTASLLIFGIHSLANILLQVAAFEIKIGSADALLKHYPANSTRHFSDNQQFVHRAVVLPYDVYEVPTRGGTIQQAKTYIFLKMAYSLLQGSFQLQMRSFEHIDQYYILYERIPQVIIFEGKANEEMEFIRPDPSLYNPHFIIKNTTAQSKNQRPYTLNFYSLRITKYIEKLIESSEIDMKSAANTLNISKMLEQDGNFTEVSSDDVRKELILQKFLSNDVSSDKVYPMELLNVEMMREITSDTLWSVQYDGFSIIYCSGALNSEGESEGSIDLFIIVSREREEKRVQHIKQPLKYLNLSVIKHLQLCSSMEKIKLAMADSHNLYLIDITTHIWNLQAYKVDQHYQHILFDQQCKLYLANNRTVSEVDALHKIQFQSSIVSVHPLQDVVVFCLEGDVCKVHSQHLLTELMEIKPEVDSGSIDWEESAYINDSAIEFQLTYRSKWKQNLASRRLHSIQIINTSNATNYSYFYELIYPYNSYHNKSLLREREMDKIFFNHFRSLQNREIYKLPSNYFHFSQVLAENINICNQNTVNDSDEKITINSEKDWTICPISKSISSLLLFKIVAEDVEAKMYICESPLKKESGNEEINCQYYTTPANSEKSYYISSNKEIKFYILRIPKQKHFPTFYFRDIEKQQLAFASTVFFFLMLILALSFLLIILFIVLRPLVTALLIYFGWRQDLTMPTYPLGWFQLKIKIKKLVEMDFLKYVPHQPRNEDEDNHCCFCLENLSKGVVIAQLYCEHEFHKECFNEWIKNEPNLRCPTCRRQFTRQHLNDFRSTHSLMIG